MAPLFVPKDRKSLFRQFLAGMYDAVVITDPNGHILEINPRAEEHFGYVQDEVIDRPISLYIPGLTPEIVQRIRRGLAEDRHMMLDANGLNKDGSKFACEVTVSVIDLMDPGDLVFTVRNVERRRRVREMLRAKENAFQIAQAALFACDAEGRFTQVNDTFLRMFGLENEDEARKHVFADFMTDDPLPANFQKALAGEESTVGIVAEGEGDERDEIEITLGPNRDGRKVRGVVGSVRKACWHIRRAPQHAAGIVSLAVNKPDPKVLQDFLALKFALSRRTAKAVIDGRSVWVNRKCVWIARFALRTGDVIEVPQSVVRGARKQGSVDNGEATSPSLHRSATEATRTSLLRETRHIRVLWQDDDYLVCDKPAGVLSCDDPKSAETLLRVQEDIPTLEAVHRLDRDTTGCLMFAKNHAALEAAIEVFKAHRVSKIYNAIVAGGFKFLHQIVETPIDGESAVSKITREDAGSDASFLRVRIETGRTNQIRKHLASIRYPIVGDRVFGLKNARDPRFMQVPRCMLHAATLEMPHPRAPKSEIKVHSPLPADFRATLKLFGMGK